MASWSAERRAAQRRIRAWPAALRPSLAPGYRALAVLAPHLPAALGFRVAEALGALLAQPWFPPYRAVLDNLRVVMPEADRAHRQLVARRVLQGICLNYYDLFRWPHLADEQLRAAATAQGLEHVHSALARGRGVVVVAPHCGPYTIVFGALIRQFDTQALLVVERIADPQIHAAVNRMRRMPGIEVEPLGPQAGRAVVRALRRNQIVILGGDRAIGENNVVVRFFGRPTPLPSGPATLALRTGAPLVTGCVRRLPDRRAWACFDPPLAIDRGAPAPTAVRDVTQKIAYIMEAYIRRDPAQWLVAQRVWPDP